MNYTKTPIIYCDGCLGISKTSIIIRQNASNKIKDAQYFGDLYSPSLYSFKKFCAVFNASCLQNQGDRIKGTGL